MKKTILAFFLASLILGFGATVFAQEKTPPPVRPAVSVAPPEAAAVPALVAAPIAETQTQPASPAPEASTEPPVAQTTAAPAAKAEPVLRTELIKLKYADPENVAALLRGYQSRYGRVFKTLGPENTIVVTDTPEIVEKMLAIVRDVDVKPVEIVFTLQLVQGSEADEKGDEALKNDPLIKDLRGVLKYKTFSLLDGTIMRVIDGEMAESKFGPKGEYMASLRPYYTKDGTAETIKIQVRLGRMGWTTQSTANSDKKGEPGSVQTQQVASFNELIRTTLQIKAGDKTVVGVSKSDGDKGLILILSGKVNN